MQQHHAATLRQPPSAGSRGGQSCNADDDFLEKRGCIIGPYDMLIAAHAIALDATLVTDNTREFQRVPRLRIENWLTT